MADEHSDSSKEIIETVLTIGGIILFLAILWWYNGGLTRESVRGLFLKPPPPVGTGEVYGPEIGPPSQNQNQ